MSYQVRPSGISSIFSTKCWFNLNLYNSCQLIESSTLHKVKNYTWFFFILPMRHAPSAEWPISPFLASQYILPETNWFVNSQHMMSPDPFKNLIIPLQSSCVPYQSPDDRHVSSVLLSVRCSVVHQNLRDVPTVTVPSGCTGVRFSELISSKSASA